jgi:hypothetical protein
MCLPDAAPATSESPVHGNLDATPVVAADGVPLDVHSQATDATDPLNRFEHQAVGLGVHAGESVNESNYRAERALIGADGAPSAVQPGDVNMPQRTSYQVLP